MALAVTIWNDRISPVFDVAARVLIIKKDSSGELGHDIKKLSKQPIQDLIDYEVSELICGAISKGLYTLAISKSIRVNAFIAGNIDEVVKAWQEGQLDGMSYSMPGCGRVYRHKFCKKRNERKIK